MTGPRKAIIDIGSNSVRLVVYGGPPRAPGTLFNEKVSAGLGQGLGERGTLKASAVRQALRALARFKAVVEVMGIASVRTVATAAVRDARDGAAFLNQVRALGLEVDLLSGEEEAAASGSGVLSAFPFADGIVGDLGGGSLELVRIRAGRVSSPISLPLGILRLPAIRANVRGLLDRRLHELMEDVDATHLDKGLPFYMVGGSWRALARLHMHLTDYPLHVLHNYEMPPQAALRLVRALGRMDRPKLKTIAAIPGGRIAALPDAAALLSAIVRRLSPTALIVSAYGLREGLLYGDLTESERQKDPLIEAARATGEALGRFPEHGDLLAQWIGPLFLGETSAQRRLRHAACLLSDVAWTASPELRAERGQEIALTGNWVGIDSRERAVLAHALYTSFGGGTAPTALVSRLASPDDCALSTRWGLAMRLGQRLSGGAADPLVRSSLSLDEQALTLNLPAGEDALWGDAVERRQKQLAAAFARTPVLGTQPQAIPVM